ncbi:hypothetical protein EDD18DRAFT_1117385 [Armillaria luteobubalina]|uniref:Uncharacterized protein n=1 Tax=Armillaria luteobubalina TaxID=153913 RepID=A0AA39NX62_9AGAR|nr:hypothetical protein EDD18DRAFT_1117385 [Armillaria luteobubalina]
MLCSVEDVLCLAAVMGASSSSPLTLILTFQFWCFSSINNARLRFCVQSAGSVVYRGLPSWSMGSGVRGGRTWPLSITARSCTPGVTSSFCAKTTYRLPASKVNEDRIAYRVVPLEYGLRGAGREDAALVLVFTVLMLRGEELDYCCHLLAACGQVYWLRWEGVGAEGRGSFRRVQSHSASSSSLPNSIALAENISLNTTLSPGWHPNFAPRRCIAFRRARSGALGGWGARKVVMCLGDSESFPFDGPLCTTSCADSRSLEDGFWAKATNLDPASEASRAAHMESRRGKRTADIDREDDDPPITPKRASAHAGIRKRHPQDKEWTTPPSVEGDAGVECSTRMASVDFQRHDFVSLKVGPSGWITE